MVMVDRDAPRALSRADQEVRALGENGQHRLAVETIHALYRVVHAIESERGMLIGDTAVSIALVRCLALSRDTEGIRDILSAAIDYIA